MAVCILHDARADMAALYCSTSDFAFGPVFMAKDGRDAEERAQAFLRWFDDYPCNEAWLFGRKDPRNLDDAQIERAYLAWLAQEAEQLVREQTPEPEEA